MSAEPARKRAYSVPAVANSVPAHWHELTFSKIAKNLNVAISTAHRVYQNFEISGDVQPVIRSSRPELRVLIVIGLIVESPTLYLDEVCRKVCDLTSLTVSPALFAGCSNVMA